MTNEIVSHIGIAVRDLDQSVAIFEMVLGRKVEKIAEVSDQKVRVAIFGRATGETAHAARIELVSATSADSPIARFIDKRGEGLHHLCIYVENIEQKLSELREAGIKLIDEAPRTGAEGGKIAFVHPSGLNGVLLEIHQKSS